MELTHKTALVTGGSRGIGRAIAEALLRAGANVAITARSAEELHDTARELEHLAKETTSDSDQDLKIAAVLADISKLEDVRRVFSAVTEELGPVDILVSNAGVQGPIGPLEEADPEEFSRTLEINLTGTWLCMREAIPAMKVRGGGKIITLSGGGATGPRERFSAYAAAKAAVVRLTETAAVELRPFSIDVNSIAPGAVNTRMLEELLEAAERAGGELEGARKRDAEGGTPPEKAAELAVFLASPASDGITGKLLSAVWDPWRDTEFQLRLREDAALGTLRRIDDKNFGSIG